MDPATGCRVVVYPCEVICIIIPAFIRFEKYFFKATRNVLNIEGIIASKTEKVRGQTSSSKQEFVFLLARTHNMRFRVHISAGYVQPFWSYRHIVVTHVYHCTVWIFFVLRNVVLFHHFPSVVVSPLGRDDFEKIWIIISARPYSSVC